jgi:putative phosphoribosyl transferase
MNTQTKAIGQEQPVQIVLGRVALNGDLTMPEGARGVVLFAHGSGSSRKSPRNRYVARVLQEDGFATLLLDLLTGEEEAIDEHTRHLRFDIGLLASRLVGATDWLGRNAPMPQRLPLPIGYFGASTGAGAALVAAAERPEDIHAVVSRGGRPDLAETALRRVQAPTLLIVGENDPYVISLNEQALQQLSAETKELVIVPKATHLFEEPGTLEKVARLAADWFTRYLAAAP